MSIKLTELSNGIRVVTEHMAHVGTVSIAAHFDVGARYETDDQGGLTHLLEHMAFKGTRRRTARQIAEEIESVGGLLNAFTSREHTTFHARVMKEDTELAIDILSDILRNSTFEPEELDREKDVIIQEIGQAYDTPDDIIFDLLQEAAFPEQPLGRSILGTPESVRRASRESLSEYLRRHYIGRSLVISAAGSVDHEVMLDLIDTQLGDLPAGDLPRHTPAQFAGGRRVRERNLEQLHLAVAFPGFAFSDPDYYALQTFSTMCGGGMSSRLFQEVRENRGLAYSVYSFASSHRDTGIFGIYAGTSPSDAEEAIPVIASEVNRFQHHVEGSDLDRARAQLKAGLLMSLESTSSRAEQLGRHVLLFGRPKPTEELIAHIDSVQADDICRVAKRVLAGPMAVAVVGPEPARKISEAFGIAFSAGS